MMSILSTWVEEFERSSEVSATTAAITIQIEDQIATRLEDFSSKSVKDSAILSAYPLALWFAASWWRLRWEPPPSHIALSSIEQIPSDDWRLNHELPSAGHGFIWPRVTFASDGTSMRVTCQQSPLLPQEPIRYLSAFEVNISASDFEIAVDEFISSVIQRLEQIGKADSDLSTLWNEVKAERAEPEQSSYRKVEALLGYDPDESPQEVVSRFLNLTQLTGSSAAEELASICAGPQSEKILDSIIELSQKTGLTGRFEFPKVTITKTSHSLPWQRACELAKTLRNQLSLGNAQLSDSDLAELLGIPEHSFRATADTQPPIGLATCSPAGEINLHFHKKNRPARRFEAARIIADYLSSGDSDTWLPIANTLTARQKLQKAFAAEFLCPIAALRDYLGENFSPDDFQDAADHFGVSEIAVRTQLANNFLISRALVNADSFV